MDIYTLYTKPLIYDKALDERIKKRRTKKEKERKATEEAKLRRRAYQTRMRTFWGYTLAITYIW